MTGTDRPYETPPPPPSAGPGSFSAPPPPPRPPTQLTRDPYTKLGGVASGIAHHYAIDVSVVRILFVVFTLSTGFGALIYLLAWLIMPRAQYWPPVPQPIRFRSVSGRELGLGLAVFGVLIALFFSGGGLSQVLVPLVLISGGVWLLSQPPAAPTPPVTDPFGTDRSQGSPTGVGVPPTPATYTATNPAAPVHPRTGASAPTSAPVDNTTPLRVEDPRGYDDRAPQIPPPSWLANELPPGSPVPPRRRRRRMRRLLLLPFLIGIPLMILFAIIGIASSSFEGGGSVLMQPMSPEELPSEIRHSAGEVELDLTFLEPEMFEGEDVPIPIDIRHDFGEVRIIVPEDLPIDVQSSADLGEVVVFENVDDGVEPSVLLSEDEPILVLNVEVTFGAIYITYE